VVTSLIEADGDVEILDKDVYICTISEGARSTWRCAQARRGYIRDKNFDADCSGFIPVDSSTRAVRKVNYVVEAAVLARSDTTSSRSRSRRTHDLPQMRLAVGKLLKDT